MCQDCVTACREIFPDVSDNEMGDFLLATTCYPFGTPKDVREQLIQNKQRMTTSDWRECYAIADADLTETTNEH